MVEILPTMKLLPAMKRDFDLLMLIRTIFWIEMNLLIFCIHVSVLLQYLEQLVRFTLQRECNI